MLDLTDRVAIVTGAGRGIGKATAITLAEAGADVAVTDVVEEREATVAEIEEGDAGGDAIAFEVDVTDRDAVERAVEGTLDEFGRIDVLVNNAGIFPIYELDEITPEEWHHVLDVNLTGAFHCTQAVLPAMVEQEYGRIINISSVSGGHVGWAGNLAHYAASKGGMIGFTKSAAIALGPDGITMNAILPGMIDTGAAEQVSTPEQVKSAIEMTPVGRQGEPEEIGFLVAVLSSEHTGFLTGASIVVDGGYTLV